MVKPRSSTSNKKFRSRKGKSRKTDLVRDPKERAKRKAAHRKREEEYWASLAGPLTVSKVRP